VPDPDEDCSGSDALNYAAHVNVSKPARPSQGLKNIHQMNKHGGIKSDWADYIVF
jgi:hypothetical protein